MRILSKSRYEKNKKLYEKVKNNDFEDYNNNVVDRDLDFNPTVLRKEYQEKKRLSKYFDDLDTNLHDVNIKLDSLKKDDTLEMKEDVDLKTLIESAKKKQMESGGKIFSNTQHEILDSLSVEEDPDKEIELENIVCSDDEEMQTTNEFDNTLVLENGYNSDEVNDFDETSEIKFDSFDSLDNENDIKESSVFMGLKENEIGDQNNEKIESELSDEDITDFDEFTSEFDFDEDDYEEIEEETDEVVEDKPKKKRGLNSIILTVILVLLILLFIVLGIIVLSQYLEVF